MREHLKSLPFSGAGRAGEREARERVHGVMDAADLKRARGHQVLKPYAVVSGFRRGKPLHAVTLRDPPFTRRFRSVAPEGFRFFTRKRAASRKRILAVQHRECLRLQDPALRVQISVEISVPVNMVLGDIRDRRGVAEKALRRLKLEA